MCGRRRRQPPSCLRFSLARIARPPPASAHCAAAAGSQSPVITPLMRVQRHLTLTGCITSSSRRRPVPLLSNQTFIFVLRPSMRRCCIATLCLCSTAEHETTYIKQPRHLHRHFISHRPTQSRCYTSHRAGAYHIRTLHHRVKGLHW